MSDTFRPETEITPKRRAELEINAILQRLEVETDRAVVTVRLRHADVTYLYAAGQEDLAGIEIQLHPGPENRVWEVKP